MSVAERSRPRHPLSLSHAERDAMGHFASRLREEEYLARRRSRWDWYVQRYADLMKVFRARIGRGGRIPEGIDDASSILRAFAYHFQARPDVEHLDERLTEWCIAHCENWTRGWRDKGDIIRAILQDVAGRRRDLGARQVALELHVTWAERCRLGLRTIGAFDLTPGEFRKRVVSRKRQNDRERAQQVRRQQGCKERAIWLAENSTSRNAPWKALGISRAKFYRLGLHRQGETGPSRIGEASNAGDGPVSRPGVGRAMAPAKPVKGRQGVRATPFAPGPFSAGTTTARQEAAAPDDALRPCGIANRQSHSGRPQHG